MRTRKVRHSEALARQVIAKRFAQQRLSSSPQNKKIVKRLALPWNIVVYDSHAVVSRRVFIDAIKNHRFGIVIQDRPSYFRNKNPTSSI